MPKIAMIGAGSIIFCKTLAMDTLSTNALQDSEICLMSRTRPKLERMERFLERVIDKNGLGANVWSTLDPKEALAGADLPPRCRVEGSLGEGVDSNFHGAPSRHGLGVRNTGPFRGGARTLGRSGEFGFQKVALGPRQWVTLRLFLFQSGGTK